MPYRFADDLSAALAERFGVRVPVVEVAREDACIVAPPIRHGGDPYSGHETSGTVDLLHFVRPDGGGPMTLHLAWTVHELSGQLDWWQLEATGFADTALEALLEPRGSPHISVNARVSITIR